MLYPAIDQLVSQLETMPHMSVGSGYDLPDEVLDQRTRSYRRNTLEELKYNLREEWQLALETVAPYQLPPNHVYFLKTYGGLAWRTPDRYGYIAGVGSSGRIEYFYLSGEYGCAMHNGFLIIGGVVLSSLKRTFATSIKSQAIFYVLDLGGTILPNAILQMDASSGQNHEVMIEANSACYATREPQEYVIAPGFTEFLQAIVATQGRLEEQFPPLILDDSYLR